MMKLPLVGTFTVKASHRVVRSVLPVGSRVHVETVSSETYRVTSDSDYEWSVGATSPTREAVLGEVENRLTDEKYGFVIAVGGRTTVEKRTRGILGILYPLPGGPIEDEDPGTWEADEIENPSEPDDEK